MTFIGNKFFRILVFALLSFACVRCNIGKKENPDLTIIQGHIEDPRHDKIYFYSYADTIDFYLEKKTALDSSLIDKKGNYSFSLHLKSPSVFNLVNGNDNLVTNLFISPGEEIKINFIGKKKTPEIFPSGKESKYNTYLVRFLETFYLNPETKQEYYIATNYMDMDLFNSYNETRKKKQLSFFENFFRDDSLSREFKDYALNTIYYGIAVDRLMYLWKKRMKGDRVSASPAYFSFETPSFIENKNAISCPAYIRFLNLYIKDIYERMVEHEELLPDKQQKNLPQVEKYNLALHLLKKPYCDVVLFNIISADMNDVAEKNASPLSTRLPLDSMIAWFKRKYSME